jgi:hypothetical protein
MLVAVTWAYAHYASLGCLAVSCVYTYSPRKRGRESSHEENGCRVGSIEVGTQPSTRRSRAVCKTACSQVITAESKTEILHCLKRRIAREVYSLLISESHVTVSTGNPARAFNR